jgi:hypothetical protein
MEAGNPIWPFDRTGQSEGGIRRRFWRLPGGWSRLTDELGCPAKGAVGFMRLDAKDRVRLTEQTIALGNTLKCLHKLMQQL